MLTSVPDVLVRLLSARWNGDVELGAVELIEPWSVARWHVTNGPVDSVIVKWVRGGNPEDPRDRAHPSQLTTEAVSLSFLEEIGVRAPRFIAAEQEVLVMEDLVGYIALDERIRRDGYGERTGKYLVEAARLLADQHAQTSPVIDLFYRRLAQRVPVDRQRDRWRFLGQGWQRVQDIAAVIGCPPGAGAVAEADEVRRRLVRPGPFMALSNGDSATNNILVGPSESVIIDFEFAGYRHCLSDLAGFYLPGPRWVTVADAASNGFEEAYRTTLAAVVPEALDDARFGTDLAAVGLTHAFGRLANFSKVDARPPGDLSRMERMITLESAAALADTRGAFPALASWCRQLGQALRRRWRKTNISTDQLPPFLPRQ